MPFITGLILSLTLIVSIGAQNVFVIKQAIKRQYAYQVAFICGLCDMVLIIFSVFMTSAVTHYFPMLRPILLILAIVFLFYYGTLSFKAAYNSHRMFKDSISGSIKKTQQTLLKVILITLSFSLLNPQAILEVVVFLGAVSAKYKSLYMQLEFMVGAMLASVIWFFTLTIVSMYLSRFIKKPQVWKYLELFTAIFMYVIAVKSIFMLFHY